MQGEKPAILPERAVEQLLARTGPSGLIRLPEAPLRRFKSGDPVRVNEGVFQGYHGIYQEHGESDRVKILLDVLGRKTRVLVGEDHLDLVEAQNG